MRRRRRRHCPEDGHEPSRTERRHPQHGPPWQHGAPWHLRHHHRRHHHRSGWRRPRRVFWRVYLYGVVMLFAVMFSLGLLSWISNYQRTASPGERAANYLGQRLSRVLDEPLALQGELDLLHQTFEADVSLFAADGRRLAYAGQALEAPAELAEWQQQLDGHGYRFVSGGLVVGLPRGHALLAHSDWLRRGRGVGNLIGPLVVLLVLALVSAPLARGIVRPIERVTEAARKLGEGDLSARTGISRRDEIGTLAATVDRMAERLELMVNNERELLANVSHELRTPLARIRVAMELVSDDAFSASEQRQHLFAISDDVSELEQLIDQILAAARLDAASAGGLPLQIAELHPHDLVSRVEERFNATHQRHQLVVDVPDDLPVLQADVGLLSRLLNNLLDNAAKYALPESGPVELAAQLDDATLVLSVRDHGEGVAKDDLAMLFEPFFRADRSRQRQRGGVGLGLSLCRRIALAHGGSIHAELADGGGLRVRLTLPL